MLNYNAFYQENFFLSDLPAVRLVDGPQYGRGRIEVRKPGENWGTVCDNSFDDKEASVICKMLGFRWGKAKTSAHFGEGSGSIWMDDLNCTGDEQSIFDCDHRGWGQHDCGHHKDAGVICEGMIGEFQNYHNH